MSTKTLSNGTLSLRFMQRAKLAQKAEAEKAEVKDDSQWEISSKVKEGWGHSELQSSSEVTYESSYLPFLFPSPSEGASSEAENYAHSEPKGRRKFNAKGQEVVEEVSEPVQIVAESTSDKSRDKMYKRPATISGSSSTAHRPQKESKKDQAKSAKSLIHENAVVGTDLRAARSALRAAATDTPPPNVFLKPSGVDEPATGLGTKSASSAGHDTGVHSQDTGIKARAKRALEPHDEIHEGGERQPTDKKRRKKKKTLD